MIQDMLYRFNGQKWSTDMRSIQTNVEVDHHSFTCNDRSVSFLVKDNNKEFAIAIYRLKSGPIRFMCESKSPYFSPSQEESVINQTELYSVENLKAIDIARDDVKMEYSDDISVNIQYKPFRVTILQTSNSKKLFEINGNSMLSVDENSIDFEFYGNQIRLIGLPARDSHVFLTPSIIDYENHKNEVKGEPYRIFNSDTGGFRPPKEYSVYGAINFLQSETAATFYSNCSDTFVDLIDQNDRLTAHFISECGPIDLFIFLGDRLKTIKEFTKITGSTFFPSISNFGFGHSKWGIKDQDDAESIIRLYDDSNVLFDTFWLDIDHLQSNQPFTVDTKKFPRYEELIAKLEANGLHRNVAIIEDPHLPYNKNHQIAEDCLSKHLEVRTSDDKSFVGVCWPGDSIYPDFINSECRRWWGTKVPLNVNQWNDMNEPSVFNSVENTMPRDNIHKCYHSNEEEKIELINKSSIDRINVVYSNACNCCLYNNKENTVKFSNGFCACVRHRNVHNIYGHFHCLSTFNGVKERTENLDSPKKNSKRPFVLTRSYFAGTSRHAAVWTGDQPSTLKDLRTSIHQVCTASVCGMPYIGADIGGFFGNPDQKLLELWFVNAVWFYPFLRLHGEIQTKPRQEIVASSDVIRSALFERYVFVPYWYTLFYQLHVNKNYKNESPSLAVRFAFIDSPEIFNEYNEDYSCCEIANIGDSLLVSPVYDFGSNSEEFQSDNQKIKDYLNSNFFNLRKIFGKLLETDNFISKLNVSSNKNLLPLFIKKGKIVSLFTNPSKSIAVTRLNKLALIVALDDNGQAEGPLFLDDGDTFNFEDGDCLYRNFVCKDGQIKNLNLNMNTQMELNDNLKIATIGTIIIIKNDDDVVVKQNLDFKVIDEWEISFN